ncbi:MAG: riboflavin synthase [Armatimonadota bacterium]
MFTGLIEEIGTVKSLVPGGVTKLVVASSRVAQNVEVGDSVSVSGVCLTVTRIGEGELAFDAVPETLARSTLAHVRPGDTINLESSLRAGGTIGGHFVQGHIDGVGTVESVRQLGESAEIRIAAPSGILRYVVEKGSIAVDGISLTVASVDRTGFAVAVIPHTMQVTTLGRRRPGDRVNLEVDIIAKYVEKLLAGRGGSGGVTEDLLRDAGFM